MAWSAERFVSDRATTARRPQSIKCRGPTAARRGTRTPRQRPPRSGTRQRGCLRTLAPPPTPRSRSSRAHRLAQHTVVSNDHVAVPVVVVRLLGVADHHPHARHHRAVQEHPHAAQPQGRSRYGCHQATASYPARQRCRWHAPAERPTARAPPSSPRRRRPRLADADMWPPAQGEVHQGEAPGDGGLRPQVGGGGQNPPPLRAEARATPRWVAPPPPPAHGARTPRLPAARRGHGLDGDGAGLAASQAAARKDLGWGAGGSTRALKTA